MAPEVTATNVVKTTTTEVVKTTRTPSPAPAAVVENVAVVASVGGTKQRVYEIKLEELETRLLEQRTIEWRARNLK